MIRHIPAVSQQRLPVWATDSEGDGSVRFDSVLIMFVRAWGWFGLCPGILWEGVGKTAAERQILVVWWGSICIFFPPDNAKLMLSAARTKWGRKITSKCQTVHFAGCLALTEGFLICLKLAFDLNWGWRKKMRPICSFFHTHNKMSCLSALHYFLWWKGRPLIWLPTLQYQVFVLVQRQRGSCCLCLGVNYSLPVL